MSWGIDITGTKEGAKRAVVEQLDKIAAMYSGKPEAADVVACKTRILETIDACELAPDSYGTKWNAVIVKASGSQSGTEKGLFTASFQVSVTRTVIEI